MRRSHLCLKRSGSAHVTEKKRRRRRSVEATRLIKLCLNGPAGPDEDQQMVFHTQWVYVLCFALVPPKPCQMAAQRGPLPRSHRPH